MMMIQFCNPFFPGVEIFSLNLNYRSSVHDVTGVGPMYGWIISFHFMSGKRVITLQLAPSTCLREMHCACVFLVIMVGSMVTSET